MTFSDLECLSEVFNDTKARAVSLQQLNFRPNIFVVLTLKRLGAFLPPSATGVRKNRSAIRELTSTSRLLSMTFCTA